MELVDYTLDDHVAIVTMNSKDNRFNLTFMEAFMDVLDKIENETNAGAIVVRSAHEKIWSNGIDLDWLFPALENEGPEAARCSSPAPGLRPRSASSMALSERPVIWTASWMRP